MVQGGESEVFAGDALASLFYVANWRFIMEGYDHAAIFRAPSPLQPFWSLGIEEQFYLLHPPLVMALLATGGGRRSVLAAMLVLLTLASSLAMLLLHTSPAPRSRWCCSPRAGRRDSRPKTTRPMTTP